jgi:hypothetical protein
VLIRVLLVNCLIALLYGCANNYLARSEFSACEFPDEKWIKRHDRAKEHYVVKTVKPKRAVSGQVSVQKYKGNGKYGVWQPSIADVTSSPGGWSYKNLDLTEYAGERVRIRFTHSAREYDQSSGWYIDDLELSSRASLRDLDEGFVNWSDMRNVQKILDPSPDHCPDTNDETTEETHKCVTLDLSEVSGIEKIYLRYRYWPYYSSIDPYYSRCKYHAVQTYKGHGHGDGYHLGFIEFNDQGQLHSREQFFSVINASEEIARNARRGVIMVVFAHGWHHGAGFKVNLNAPLLTGEDSSSTGKVEQVTSEDGPFLTGINTFPAKNNEYIMTEDTDIIQFRRLLKLVAEAEYQDANGKDPREVLGIYLGWRGEASTIPGLSELTFWTRKKVAHKVGQQGVTETLLALEKIVRRPDVVGDSANGTEEDKVDNHMVIIGHSFGAAIVIGGLQKILLEKNLEQYGHLQASRDLSTEPNFDDNFNSGRNYHESKWGDDDSWRIGPPLSDRSSCFQETAGCAYSISDKKPGSDTQLESVIIDLTEVTDEQEIHLRFQSWLPYDSASFGQVQAWECKDSDCKHRNDDNSALITSEKGSWVIAATQDNVKGGWSLQDVNLTEFRGQKIRIGFKHRWPGSEKKEYWYIDDVEIVAAKPPENAKGFADLTVLINPAIEAIRYATLFDVSQRYDSKLNKCNGYQKTQTPNLVVLTSENDNATKYLFPIGRSLSTFFDTHQNTDHYRCTAIGQKPPPWKFDEESANSTALGHFEDFISHDLHAREDSLSRQSIERDNSLKNSWEKQKLGESLCFEHVVLKHRGRTDPFNPYLNISVSKEVIPDHNDIWGIETQSFLRTIIRLSTAQKYKSNPAKNYNAECGITIEENSAGSY